MTLAVSEGVTGTSNPDGDIKRHIIDFPPFGGMKRLQGPLSVATVIRSAPDIFDMQTQMDAADDARWRALLTDPDGLAMLEEMASAALAEDDAGLTWDIDELLK